MDLAAFRREVGRDLLTTDEFLDQLSFRVAALEEVAAARWPWRYVAAARLRRQLRQSVRRISGPTWRWRRIEAVATFDPATR